MKVQNYLFLQTKICIALTPEGLLIKSVLQRWLWVTWQWCVSAQSYAAQEERVHHQASAIHVFPSKSYITRQNQTFISQGKCSLKMNPLLHGSLIFYTFKAHCHVSVLPCICCGRLIVALSLPNPSQLSGNLSISAAWFYCLLFRHQSCITKLKYKKPTSNKKNMAENILDKACIDYLYFHKDTFRSILLHCIIYIVYGLHFH